MKACSRLPLASEVSNGPWSFYVACGSFSAILEKPARFDY
jgi:hypothetical protein